VVDRRLGDGASQQILTTKEAQGRADLPFVSGLRLVRRELIDITGSLVNSQKRRLGMCGVYSLLFIFISGLE
jgi:hypothetical protein